MINYTFFNWFTNKKMHEQNYIFLENINTNLMTLIEVNISDKNCQKLNDQSFAHITQAFSMFSLTTGVNIFRLAKK